MTIILQQAMSPDQIKMRWLEPYVSSSVNNKNFKTIPRGVYRGFLIEPAGDQKIRIRSDYDGTSGYQGGNFDAALNRRYSVAAHENLQGFTCCILMQEDGSGYLYEFDLVGQAGSNVYLALDVIYQIGFASTGYVKVVDAAELDANPSLLCLGMVEVPSSGPIGTTNVIYNDPNYPRVLPYASKFKDGFMDAWQAEIIEILSVPNASNAFEVEAIVSSSGPQVVNIPAGNTYVVGGNDLFVFRNGIKCRKGRDYNEIDRGDGKGDQVDWLGPLRVDDRIVFRGQEYAVALTNSLTVKDEYSVIGTGVTAINFTGTGVVTVPDGVGQVKVIIPSVTGGGTSARLKFNNTGLDILAGKCVTLLPDGTVAPCNPLDANHRPFGVTNGPILAGNYGYVVVAGVALNALLGLGGYAAGQDLYVAHTGDGTLVATPPDPMAGRVFRVGWADCQDGTYSSSALDVVVQIQRVA